MSDLISRSELIKHFNTIQQQEGAIGLDFVAMIDVIKEHPTAYSVDKVVEELETDSSVKLFGSENSDNYLIPVKRAIEIVKRGGATND